MIIYPLCVVLGFDSLSPVVIERIKEGLSALISSMGNVERAYFFAPQNLIDTKNTEGAICLVHWSDLSSEEEIRWENKITDFFKESFGLPVDVGVNRFPIL